MFPSHFVAGKHTVVEFLAGLRELKCWESIWFDWYHHQSGGRWGIMSQFTTWHKNRHFENDTLFPLLTWFRSAQGFLGDFGEIGPPGPDGIPVSAMMCYNRSHSRVIVQLSPETLDQMESLPFQPKCKNLHHKNTALQKIMDKNRHLYCSDFVHLQIALLQKSFEPESCAATSACSLTVTQTGLLYKIGWPLRNPSRPYLLCCQNQDGGGGALCHPTLCWTGILKRM